MFNTIASKKIAIFGVAFKAHTSDTRETPAISICNSLIEERADVIVTDPYALDNFRIELGDSADQITYEPDPYNAIQGSHAIAVLTEWPQYKDLDYQMIFDRMEKPAFIFDGRNILDHQKLFEMGFNVLAIGKPPQLHFED